MTFHTYLPENPAVASQHITADEAVERGLGPLEEFQLRSSIAEIKRLAESLVDSPGLINRQRQYIGMVEPVHDQR